MLIKPVVVVVLSFSMPSAVKHYTILFLSEEIISIVTRASLLALAKSIYYHYDHFILYRVRNNQLVQIISSFLTGLKPPVNSILKPAIVIEIRIDVNRTDIGRKRDVQLSTAVAQLSGAELDIIESF